MLHLCYIYATVTVTVYKYCTHESIITNINITSKVLRITAIDLLSKIIGLLHRIQVGFVSNIPVSSILSLLTHILIKDHGRYELFL